MPLPRASFTPPLTAHPRPLLLQLRGVEQALLESEILDARRQLAACGIPEGDIVGMRAPFLESDPALRGALHRHGFLYDSSLLEDGEASVSRGGSERLWPWDLQYGIPINCSL